MLYLALTRRSVIPIRAVQGMLFRYVTRSMYIAVAGRALSAWKDPRQHVKSPNVDSFLTAANKLLYEYFAKELFRHTGLKELDDSSHLVSLRDTMVATLLMYLVEFSKDVKPDDPVLSKIRSAATSVGIEYSTLVGWGNHVRTRFQSDNIAQIADSTEHPQVVDALQQQSGQLRDQANAMKRQAHEMSQINTRLDAMTDVLTQLVPNIVTKFKT